MTADPPSSFSPFDAARVAKAIRQRIQSLQRAGVTSFQTSTAEQTDLSELQKQLDAVRNDGPPASNIEPQTSSVDARLPLSAPQASVAETPAAPDTNSATEVNPTPSDNRAPNNSPQDSTVMPSQKQTELNIVCQEVANCTACTELADTRTNTVFGVGNPDARLVFYGEAPGADEDRQGEPFVGRAGQLLNKIIEAMGLTREEIYILNTIKCRPPGNRNPTPEEQQNCAGYLQRQLEIIRPEYIVCLGAIASHSFLECKTPIGKMRGQFFQKNGIKVLCTFHPAYLLRDPRRKRDVWDDIQFLMKDMGLPVPKKSDGVT